MSWYHSTGAGTGTELAGGPGGPNTVARLAALAMRAVADGAADRAGPAPAGGPAVVLATMSERTVLPEHGLGADRALTELLRPLSAGSVDPAHPWCTAHLHGPPLAVAAAADLAASVLNPSLDSWDQAPSASVLEADVSAALADLVYPTATNQDALITSGGTESNLLALLLPREAGQAREARTVAEPARPVRVLCGPATHHSVARAAWLLGMPAPVLVPGSRSRLRPAALAAALVELAGPAVVVATAGSTDTGAIDPLVEIAEVIATHNARASAGDRVRLHVDAAYGGGALLSDRLRGRLAGIERADTVSLDLHKLGWQPIAAGVLAVADATSLAPLSTTADYLNAADDTDAGLPDLLGRSLRTSRRPDVVKIAVTFAALGRAGLAAMIEQCCATATELADLVAADPRLLLAERPQLSTVLVRPAGAADNMVAELRRRLLHDGTAVVGRANAPDADGVERLWLKITVLHPHAGPADYAGLLDSIASAASTAGPAGAASPASSAGVPAPAVTG